MRASGLDSLADHHNAALAVCEVTAVCEADTAAGTVVDIAAETADDMSTARPSLQWHRSSWDPELADATLQVPLQLSDHEEGVALGLDRRGNWW